MKKVINVRTDIREFHADLYKILIAYRNDMNQHFKIHHLVSKNKDEPYPYSIIIDKPINYWMGNDIQNLIKDHIRESGLVFKEKIEQEKYLDGKKHRTCYKVDISVKMKKKKSKII